MTVVIRRSRVSNGARALAAALNEAGVRAIVSSRQVFLRAALIVNWGSREAVQTRAAAILNMPSHLDVARNKLVAFQAFGRGGVSIPRYWTDVATAEAERSKSIILERHSLTGQSGSGIVVKRAGQALGNAPLYVEYIKKTKEFRVHVFDGRAIFVQEKRRASSAVQSADDRLIRNHANGWVFAINDIQQPPSLGDLAVAACDALQLDFGAVDIIQGKDGRLYVLEVNTMPGLESPTVIAAYVAAIQRRLNNEHQGVTGNASEELAAV